VPSAALTGKTLCSAPDATAVPATTICGAGSLPFMWLLPYRMPRILSGTRLTNAACGRRAFSRLNLSSNNISAAVLPSGVAWLPLCPAPCCDAGTIAFPASVHRLRRWPQLFTDFAACGLRRLRVLRFCRGCRHSASTTCLRSVYGAGQLRHGLAPYSFSPCYKTRRAGVASELFGRLFPLLRLPRCVRSPHEFMRLLPPHYADYKLFTELPCWAGFLLLPSLHLLFLPGEVWLSL